MATIYFNSIHRYYNIQYSFLSSLFCKFFDRSIILAITREKSLSHNEGLREIGYIYIYKKVYGGRYLPEVETESRRAS